MSSAPGSARSTPGPAPGTSGARRAFLSAALRRPATMGAVAPSSQRLASVLASVVPTRGDRAPGR
jgi:phosphatidylethanolamine/phosphatidyl-N-methylethanolamine N-methyltransferase